MWRKVKGNEKIKVISLFKYENFQVERLFLLIAFLLGSFLINFKINLDSNRNVVYYVINTP